jgi:peptidoglycan/LPS O-acetylase OafA/YrhL
MRFNSLTVTPESTSGFASEASSPMQTFRLIDALRAMAAFIVVLFHVVEMAHWSGFPTAGPLRLVYVGWVGVDCFFVISGFVITLSALNGYKSSPERYGRKFMISRLGRIVPLYVLTSCLFLVIVQPDFLTNSWRGIGTHLVSHILFVHNLSPQTAGSINGPAWSIGLEMQFYVFVILVVPWLAKRSPFSILALLIPAAWSYRYFISTFYPPGSPEVFHQVVYTSFQLPGTIDEFALGMALGVAIFRNTGALSKLLMKNWVNFACWLIAAALFSVLAWDTLWPRTGNYWESVPMILFWRTLLALTFACWLAAAITFPYQRFSVFYPLCYLGKISYGVYLYHAIVIFLTMKYIPHAGVGLLLTVVVSTIVVSAISWHYLEKPIMDMVKRSVTSA